APAGVAGSRAVAGSLGLELAGARPSALLRTELCSYDWPEWWGRRERDRCGDGRGRRLWA
ncbi:MAG: hypothetical protein ACXVZW_08585, partial [Gaiellaceae bacterium]